MAQGERGYENNKLCIGCKICYPQPPASTEHRFFKEVRQQRKLLL